jgi:hypothetical protein
MRATIHILSTLHAMADNPATAMPADRSNFFNGTFETVKEMCFAIVLDFKHFIVAVAADFALIHNVLPDKKIYGRQISSNTSPPIMMPRTVTKFS